MAGDRVTPVFASRQERPASGNGDRLVDEVRIMSAWE
jgi:hypothetical protein